MSRTQRWLSAQRQVRRGIADEDRSADGLRPRPATGEGSLQAVDLAAMPIASERGLGGQAVSAVKRLLRRLMRPWLIDAQTSFNREVAEAIQQQAERVEQLAALVEGRADGSPGPSPADDLAAVPYAGFEDRFRGAEDAIRERHLDYLSHFHGRGEVLDIGCGRGEFLTLLRDRDVPARGVDLDAAMVQRCRAAGLDVTLADANDYLEDVPAGSLGGVFASQVIEHLETSQLAKLLKLAARALKPDGVLLLETINPGSWPVHSRWFPMDPTHVRLVHPATLEFLAEQVGLTVKTVQYRQPVPDAAKLPKLSLPDVPKKQLKEYNDAVDRVNDELFGPLDYFLVAQR